MSYTQDGRQVGIVVDLAEAIKRHFNRAISLKYMDWSQAQQLVLKGKADALLHINPSAERKELFDFSDDLLDSEFSIFINHTRKDIYNVNSLRGLQVGVLKKGLAFSLLNRDPSMNLIAFPDILSGFHSLERGELDAVVMDRQVGSFLLADNNIRGIRITGDPIDRSTSAIAVRKGNTELLVEINRALAEIKKNGTYTEIMAKWQPKEVVFQTREQSLIQKRVTLTLVSVTALAVLIILLALFWNKSLKSKVAERTAELDDTNTSLIAEINERKQTEDQLRKSEQKFKDFMMSADEGFVLFDSDLNISEINNKALEIFPPGSTRDNLIGTNALHMAPSLKESGRYDKYVEVKNTGGTVYFEDIVPDPYFGDRTLTVKGFKVSDGLGIIFSDTTERKRAEDNLRYQAAVLENVSDAVISNDLDFKILSWNEAAENIYGWKSEEVIGKSIRDVLQTENADLVRENMLADVQDTGVWVGETVQIRKDGERRHIQSKISRIINHEGNAIGFVGVARDITERLIADRKLLEYQKRLKALATQLTVAEEKERRRIAVDLHDNVCQSLALARIQVASVRKKVLKPTLTATLDDVSGTLQQTLQNTRHLMSNLSSPSMNEIGLSAAISEMLEESIAKQYNLKTEFTDDIDDHRRNVLEDNVQAILLRNVRELVTNVVKHSRAKKVSVRLKEEANRVKIIVKDDGIGFDADTATLKNGQVGSLGLFSIEERMSDMGGAFEIVSQPGKGCEAILTIPVGIV